MKKTVATREGHILGKVFVRSGECPFCGATNTVEVEHIPDTQHVQGESNVLDDSNMTCDHYEDLDMAEDTFTFEGE